jgi:cysteinyl-tRNA synthetase
MKFFSSNLKFNLISQKQNLFFYSRIRLYFSIMERTEKKWTHPMDNLNDKPVYRTGLKVFNSLTNQKEEFITKDGGRTVNWYMCGPTVYDSAHLGHAKTYLCFDVIRRIMTTYFGYDVVLCMNITDIDDKIIARSNERKIEYSKFTKMWEEDFFKDMRGLNIMYPTYITRVTEYIPEIVDFIKVLIQKNYAYENNGSVYFNIEEYTKNKVIDLD